MAYADPSVQREKDRERFRKRIAERRAAGICPGCGDRPPAPERALCAPCAGKRNRASRARDARLRTEGKPRRNPARARAYQRERTRREREEPRARGICIRCGERPAAPDRASCEPCLEKRRKADRAKYAAGKAAGLPYGGEMRPVRREILSRLGAFPGHPGVGPELDGDRARDRPGARAVRQRGRRGALPRLREARPRPGGDREGREPDVVLCG